MRGIVLVETTQFLDVQVQQVFLQQIFITAFLGWERIAVLTLEEDWLLWGNGRFQELVEDAAKAPHVRSVVIMLDEGDFWRPIPTWANMGGHRPLLGARDTVGFFSFWVELFGDHPPFSLPVTNFEPLYWVPESFGIARSWAGGALWKTPRQPKITDLYLAVLVDENIWGLQVSVDYIWGTDLLHGTQDIVQYGFYVVLRKLCPTDDFG